MAVLIERACTPVFASKMDVDSNSDGKVDGFSSWADPGLTATYSLDDNAQKIEVTASTAAGNAMVFTGFFTIDPNKKYSVQALSRGIVSSGNFQNNIFIYWRDASDAHIKDSAISLQAPTTYWKLYRLENITPPANAAKACITLCARVNAAGDAGSVWFRNVQFEEANTCSTFTEGTRAADAASMAIAPLSDTWSISFAVSPNFEYNNVPAGGAAWLRLFNSSAEMQVLDTANGVIQAAQNINGVWTYVNLPAIQHSRYKIIKVIVSRIKGTTYVYARPNNGTTITATATTQSAVNGLNNIALNVSGLESNSLIESVTLYRNKAITTLDEANAIFDNMNTEMVANGGFSSGSAWWTLLGGVIENSMLKCVTTQPNGVSTTAARQFVNVLPNNTYKFKARIIGYIDNNNYSRIVIDHRNCLKAYISATAFNPDTYDYTAEITFNTGADVYFLQIVCYSYGTGTFYFDDISLQLIN